MRKVLLAGTERNSRITSYNVCYTKLLRVKHQALQKAKSLAANYDDALIIGSDQVFVDARHRVLGKPGTPQKAIEQLQEMQGRKHTFYTGLAVYDSASGRITSYNVCYTKLLRTRALHEKMPFLCRGDSGRSNKMQALR